MLTDAVPLVKVRAALAQSSGRAAGLALAHSGRLPDPVPVGVSYVARLQDIYERSAASLRAHDRDGSAFTVAAQALSAFEPDLVMAVAVPDGTGDRFFSVLLDPESLALVCVVERSVA